MSGTIRKVTTTSSTNDNSTPPRRRSVKSTHGLETHRFRERLSLAGSSALWRCGPATWATVSVLKLMPGSRFVGLPRCVATGNAVQVDGPTEAAHLRGRHRQPAEHPPAIPRHLGARAN